MNDSGSEMILVITLLAMVAVACVFGALADSRKTALKELRTEAVVNGYAEWVVSPQGEAKWQWKKK